MKIEKCSIRKLVLFSLCVVACLLALLFHAPVSMVSALSDSYDNEGIKSKEGEITYTTKMTTATTDITYGTVGYIIRFDAKEGVPIGNASEPQYGSDDYAIVYYTSEGVSCKSKENANGFTYSVYTFTQEALTKAVKKAGKKFQKRWNEMINNGGDTIYLNGIFTTYHGGVCTGKRFYRHHDSGSLKGIYEAEGWADPSRFNQYYDIKVEYEPGTYPVTVKYMTEDGATIKNDFVGNYEVNTRIFSGEKKNEEQYDMPQETMDYNKDTYSLYESYYMYVDDPEDEDKQYSLLNVDDGAKLEKVMDPVDASDHKSGIKVQNGGLVIVFKYRICEYPVTIKYLTDKNELIKEFKVGSFKTGTRIKSGTQYDKPQESLTYKKHEYSIFESFYMFEDESKNKEVKHSLVSTDKGDKIEKILSPVDDSDKKEGIKVRNSGLIIVFRYKFGDYPVTVKYMTDENDLIQEFALGKFFQGDVIKSGTNYTVPHEKLSYNGKNYELYRSYYNYIDKGSKVYSNKKLSEGATLNQVQHPKDESGKSGIVVDNGGLVIIFKYKPGKEIVIKDIEFDEVEPDSISKKFPKITPKGNLRSDSFGNEIFDVDKGIPTSVSLYANITDVPGYVISYKFKKVAGKKKVTTTVKRKYTIKWDKFKEDEEGKLIPDGQGSEESTKSVNVSYEVPYGYWIVDYVSVYKIDTGQVFNQCMVDGKVVLALNEPIVVPNFDATLYGGTSNHVFLPNSYKTSYTMDAVEQFGTEDNHEIIFDDDKVFENYAKGKVSYVNVKNDKLTVDGKTIMSDSIVKTEGKTPNTSVIPKNGELLTGKKLYKYNIKIPAEKANGRYMTKGKVQYVKSQNLGKTHELTQPEEFEINDVNVHTPVVCDIKISDRKDFNQMITPDKSKVSLVLALDFKVSLPTKGTHNDYPGYRTRDYEKYTSARQVKFPFGVYRGKTYYEPNTWIDINSDITEFYLPPWVDEGQYEIKSRAISINASANSKIGNTETRLNSKPENYVATDTIKVQVTGRLYNLRLYDISSYPLWQKVFRVSEDSYKRNGFTYRVGMYNLNGEKRLNDNTNTFPLVNGSHPYYVSAGVVKKGYFVRFYLDTIGNMYGLDDYVHIKPNFYFVPYDGSSFTKVDLYYNETFNGKRNYMVKVGSELDKQNVKFARIGNYIWVTKLLQLI